MSYAPIKAVKIEVAAMPALYRQTAVIISGLSGVFTAQKHRQK